MNYETATELINENIKNTDETQCVNDILFECKYGDIPLIVKVLIDKIRDLKHYKDTTENLWATDIEPENKDNFFQLK